MVAATLFKVPEACAIDLLFIFTLREVTKLALAASPPAALPHQVVLGVRYGNGDRRE